MVRVVRVRECEEVQMEAYYYHKDDDNNNNQFMLVRRVSLGRGLDRLKNVDK